MIFQDLLEVMISLAYGIVGLVSQLFHFVAHLAKLDFKF